MLKNIVHKLGTKYISRINLKEAKAQKFKRHNERAIEYRFVFDCLNDLRPVRVLDVGTGKTALPSLMANCGCVVKAIDNVRDYWPSGMVNRHWHVQDDDIRSPKLADKFDLVTCVSVIEHIEDHRTAFLSMVNLLAPGGHLIITTPYNEHRSVPDVYKLPRAAYGQNFPFICRSSSRAEIDSWLSVTPVNIVRQEYWEFWTGDVWTQGEPIAAPRQVNLSETHQLTCILLQKPS